MSAPAFAVDNHSEESVKAAFVLRFAGYVEWPLDQISSPAFTIAVLGASDVAVRLQELTAGRSVQGRPVQVRRIASIQDAASAQLLYIGTDRRGDLQDQLASLAGRNILVISSEDGALAAGSVINLLLVDNRMRFEVSLQAARLARLRISSELLSLAVWVQK
jgi:hypothetical protein